VTRSVQVFVIVGTFLSLQIVGANDRVERIPRLLGSLEEFFLFFDSGRI